MVREEFAFLVEGEGSLFARGRRVEVSEFEEGKGGPLFDRGSEEGGGYWFDVGLGVLGYWVDVGVLLVWSCWERFGDDGWFAVCGAIREGVEINCILKEREWAWEDSYNRFRF